MVRITAGVEKDVVAKAGYDIVSVDSEPYEKKGLFSAFGK